MVITEPTDLLYWFATSDTVDGAINASAGFADSMTFGLAWVWRDKVWGTDDVGYGSGTYIGGQIAGTLVQLPNLASSVKVPMAV